MKESLILYLKEFSPITITEAVFAASISKAKKMPVAFLPLKEGEGASYEDRLEMIKAAIKEQEADLLIDRSLLDASLHECLGKYANKDLYVLMDEENRDFINREHANDFSSFKKINAKDIGFIFPSSEKDNRSLSYIDLDAGVLRLIHDKGLYYLKEVAPYLSEKRLKHSESVALLSYEIAISNNLPEPGRAYIAGLLHDIGKYVEEKDALRIMEEEGVEEAKDCPNWAYHQFVGALLARDKFHIKDEEILSAIRYHCSGCGNMTPLGEIIYSADKIDPLRLWDSASYIKECKSDYHQGFIDVLRANREFLHEKMGEEADKCALSEKCYEAYL